jgi:hypothetical protein
VPVVDISSPHLEIALSTRVVPMIDRVLTCESAPPDQVEVGSGSGA